MMQTNGEVSFLALKSHSPPNEMVGFGVASHTIGYRLLFLF